MPEITSIILHADCLIVMNQAKTVLRLFDELAKCDEEGVLKDVRKAVEGN